MTTSGRACWLAIMVVLATVQASADTPGSPVVSASGAFTLSFTPSGPLTINRMHSWTIHLRSSAGEPITDAAIDVAGGMPEHDHGLPTMPRMTRNLGGGDYLIEGMKFHMSGRWRLDLVISTPSVEDTAVVEIDLR